MRKHDPVATLALVLFLLQPSTDVRAQQPGAHAEPVAPVAQAATAPTDAAMTEFLRKARVVRTRELDKGVTGSVRATLSDGTLTHDAHIQTVDVAKREFKGKNATEINFRDSWRFNVAAYRIDRLLALDLVPVSVERGWKGYDGAYTWWVDDVLMDEGERLKKDAAPPDTACWNDQMWSLRMFDQLIDNIDRNLGNLLISQHWRLWAIDHTRAFRYAKAPRQPDQLARIDRGVLQRLKALEFATLKSEVGRYLSDGDIRTLLLRRDAIVARYEQLGEAGLFDRRSPSAGCRVAPR